MLLSNRMPGIIFFIIFIAISASNTAIADEIPVVDKKLSYLAIIIDDLGYRPTNDQRALMLEGQIAYAFLPYTPHAKRLARLAHKNNKEVILHLPMESEGGRAQENHTLLTSMDKQTFLKVVEDSLSAIPYVSGINNHMGSLLSQSSQHMHWLMSFITSKKSVNQLFFIDSRTSHKTIAEEVAKDYHVQSSRRNVFLDHVHTRKALDQQYQRSINIAIKQGSAIVIAHPFELTLEFLEEKIPELAAQNIKLVTIKEIIAIQKSMRKGRG